MDSEGKIRLKSQKVDLARPVHKYCIENDINKLFDAIDLKNSYRALVLSEKGSREAFNKNAMKRPMRVGPRHTSGIGISESASLKQALRGLCISHASGMATTKKLLSKAKPFPGISEVGNIKRLYRTVVVDSSEAGILLSGGKGDLLEISLVSEASSSANSLGIPHRLGHVLSDSKSHANSFAPLTDAVIQTPRTETPHKYAMAQSSVVGRKEKLKLLDASIGISSTRKLPMVDENVSDSVGAPVSSVTHKEDEGRSTISSSTFSDGGSDAFKSASSSSHFIKRLFRRKYLANKRLVSNLTSPSGGSYQCNSGLGDVHSEIMTTDFSLSRPHTENEVSPESSSSFGTADVGSIYFDAGVYNPTLNLNSGHKNGDRSGSRERGKISPSSKSSAGDNRSSSSFSEESSISGSSCRGFRPHMSKDMRWKAIHSVKQQHGNLGLKNLKLLKKLGGGDVGDIYLSELIGTNCLFALKVMDTGLLARRGKLHRAQTETKILQVLDHPFLPTLYAHFATEKFSCLLMEYCRGGDLHVLRQKEPSQRFSEQAARFYVAEVVLALEYLHMLGIVYRDLKPENVLVREDGHIMLTDFDLSLRCATNLTMVKSSSPVDEHPNRTSTACLEASCIYPICLHTSMPISCFNSKFLSVAVKTQKPKSHVATQTRTLPQLITEPTDARSNSFVGTHEYLAPEIIKGEGHGSGVDWWTLGIFLYELLYGKTPFKGQDDEDTFTKIVSKRLKFPETPTVGSNARDLIRCLLQKQPQKRLGFEKGAVEIKQHPFFQGLNWALIRCAPPPKVPNDMGSSGQVTSPCNMEKEKNVRDHTIGENIVFEMF